MSIRLLKIPMAALAVVGLFAAPVQAATVVGSKHDLRLTGGGTATGSLLVEVCASCHTPHQAAGAASQDPLWNHTGTSTAAFGVYGSTTLQATPTEIGGVAMGGQSISMLCMSCHDGTVSVLSMYNPPNSGVGVVTPIAGRIDGSGFIISSALIGTSLSDDHPVNFDFDAALIAADTAAAGAPGLVLPTGTLPLFGNTVQCATCHNPHDPTNIPFLRVSNVASALCTTCHLK